MMFSPGDFFAWEHFAYRDIFEGVEYVWEALTQIDDYLRSHTSSRNEIRGLVHPGAYLVGQHILIEEDAEVEPGAYIHGPCIIGRGCIVRHGAYVRADTLA
ncbi:MAG: hypothetical protein IMW89_16480, partial [Ktedonobacteraceae bacterium]|nr:hypothetical protein [Ktedonobacteraceae bacterium]